MNIKEVLKKASGNLPVCYYKVCHKIAELISDYQNVISSDEAIASHIEKGLRILSYILPSYIDMPQYFSELLYLVSKLLEMLHDFIYCKRFLLVPAEDLFNMKAKIKYALAITEYSEAFFEIGGQQLWGETGKWLTVLMIQFFKALLKLALVYMQPSIVSTEPFQDVNRAEAVQNADHRARSDRKRQGSMRYPSMEGVAVEERPSVRDWRTDLKQDFAKLRAGSAVRAALPNRQFIGELLYIARPLAHLTAMFACGERSWKPFIASLVIEAASMRLITAAGKGARLYPAEKVEVANRKLNFLLYLLRSPMYDRATKMTIDRVLKWMRQSIPLAGHVVEPIEDYLPTWRKTYAYCWSS